MIYHEVNINSFLTPYHRNANDGRKGIGAYQGNVVRS